MKACVPAQVQKRQETKGKNKKKEKKKEKEKKKRRRRRRIGEIWFTALFVVVVLRVATADTRKRRKKKARATNKQTSKQTKQNKGKEKKRASERLVLFVCVGLCVAGTEFKNCAPRQKPKQSPVKNDSDTQSNRCFASMPKKEGEPDEECRLCGAIGVAKLMMFGTRGMRGKGGMSTAVGLSKAAIHSPDQAKEDYLLCVCVCVCVRCV